MTRTLHLFCPSEAAPGLGQALETIFKTRIRLERRAPAPLDLGDLRCFFIRFRGSLMTSRAPFVFPLMDVAYHRYYRTERDAEPHAAFGADWVFLGGDAATFCTRLAQQVLSNRVAAVVLHPFTEVQGTLPEERRPDDVPLTLVKQPNRHNDRLVQKNRDMLLNRPPEEWDCRKYALVGDRYAEIEPFLKAHLAAAPRTIVELGCGLGNTTDRLAREFPEARVVGYDYSAASIEVCRHGFARPNLEFRVADFTRPLPLATDSVDLLVSLEATNMSATPVFTAGECCRALAPDGLLVNCSLSESSYAAWDFPASLFTPVHMNTFATDWYAMAREAGLGFRLAPWQLKSFTFLAARDPEFARAHREFCISRRGAETFALHHDRFAMIVGRHVAGTEPTGEQAHLLERSYRAYVRRCLASLEASDPELRRFAQWSRRLVDAELRLLPGGRAFVQAVLTPEAVCHACA